MNWIVMDIYTPDIEITLYKFKTKKEALSYINETYENADNKEVTIYKKGDDKYEQGLHMMVLADMQLCYLLKSDFSSNLVLLGC